MAVQLLVHGGPDSLVWFSWGIVLIAGLAPILSWLLSAKDKPKRMTAAAALATVAGTFASGITLWRECNWWAWICTFPF